MPDMSRVNILASDSDSRSANYVYVTDNIRTINADTFNSCVTSYIQPEPNWQTIENPYYDYVSELSSILKDVKIKDSGVYINDEYASYRVLTQTMNKICNIYNRYNNIKTRKEPSSKGDEYNE